jgi:hypothetical protein
MLHVSKYPRGVYYALSFIEHFCFLSSVKRLDRKEYHGGGRTTLMG